VRTIKEEEKKPFSKNSILKHLEEHDAAFDAKMKKLDEECEKKKEALFKQLDDIQKRHKEFMKTQNQNSSSSSNE